MSNAVAKVPMATVPWGDDKKEIGLKASTLTFYPGAMIARDSSGRGVKCDDTSGLNFEGINAEADRVQGLTGDADGDRVVKVERPWRFTMAIAAAVAGDEGKKLYAVDDNHVGYTSSNSILVGFVDQVLSATSVLVNPLYAPLNPVAVSSNILAFAGATGVDQITFPDNLADALTFAEGSNAYLTFITTDGSELVKALKNVTLSNATTPILTLDTGMTNTGYIQVKGKTSGMLKITAADATAQTVTLTTAAQTVGAATYTIPDAAGAAQTIVTLALAQTLTNKTLTAPILTGMSRFGIVATPVAAAGAGGGVAGAAALSTSSVVYVSSDGATKGVKLTTGTAGEVKWILNTSSTACNLFAASGGTINGGGADAGCAIPASKGVLAYCSAADTWTVFDMAAHAGAAA